MTQAVSPSQISTVILACEAGMGSSLMSVNALKKKFKAAGINNVKVVHKAARQVPADAKLVVVHKGLVKVIQGQAPEAVVVAFNHFLNDPAFDSLVKSFKENLEIKNS